MSPLSTAVLTTFVLAALVAFIVPFLRGPRAKPDFSPGALKPFACLLFPFLLLFLAGQYFGSPSGHCLSYFACASALPFILRRLGISSAVAGVALTICAVFLTFWLDKDAAMPLAATIAGLCFYKAADCCLYGGDGTLDDILPPLVWLGGLYWINAASPAALLVERQGFLAGAIAVSLLMRVIQGPFLVSDPLYVKRIVLSATAGLLFLIYITKVLAAPALEIMALVFGGAHFLVYLIEAADGCGGEKRQGQLSDAVKVLVMIGIYSVLASRLYGTFGWLAIAPAAILSSGPSAGAVAGAFWLGRTVLQGYIALYNPNVTGINITHAYAGAALYAGFLFALVMSLALRDLAGRRILAAVLVFAGAALPLASNYFIHAEATSSLLVAVCVASVILSIAAPAIYRQERHGQEMLIVLPLYMVACASLGHELIDAGNTAVAGDRLKVLAALGGASVLLSLLVWWAKFRSAGKSVDVPGDQSAT